MTRLPRPLRSAALGGALALGLVAAPLTSAAASSTPEPSATPTATTTPSAAAPTTAPSTSPASPSGATAADPSPTAAPDAAIAVGGLSPVLLDPVQLDAGTTTTVPIALRVDAARLDLVGTVALEAPAGSTFVAADTAAGWWRPGGDETWRRDASLDLRGGSVGDGATRTSFTLDTSGFAAGHADGDELRFDLAVATPLDAEPDDSELTWTAAGAGGAGGAFEVQGATYTVTEPAPSAAPVLTVPARVADGYTADAPYTFRGTGRPNAPLTVLNTKGLPLGSTTVLADGTWSWTRPNMGTYEWSLVFVQDAGTPRERETRLLGFVPAQGPQIAVTTPDAAQLARGYAPDAPYTFRGTGRPGALIGVTNLSGFRLGEARVGPEGTWSWTRADMGSYLWSMAFVQDEGTYRPSSTVMRGFAPAVDAPRLTTPSASQIAAGYPVYTAYTFAGTGKPGALIDVLNTKGLQLGRAVVAPDGTWSWRIGTLQAFIWSIDFVQERGTDGELVAPLRGFAPRA